MKTKIEWYKEVLELEPHSKLFFPLARLYVAEERYDEALETLTVGLKQHPEFLEARLLLLEVLNSLGKAGDLSEHARGLAETFSGYFTFWQTWAHLLSREQQGKDTALALNFLASHFRGNSLSWTDVIERGIHSLVFDDTAFPEAADSAGVTRGDPRMGSVVKSEQSVSLESSDQEETPAEDDFGQDVDLDDLMETDVEQLHAVAGTTKAELDKNEDALQKHDRSLFEEDSDDAETIFRATEDAQTSYEESDADEEVEEDEPFSLRTRTMADLLAEQGDFEGALDIYRELLAITPSGESRESLEGLIKEMATRIREKKGLQPAPSGKRKVSSKSASSEHSGLSGKKKLIDTLELLAQRLEARGAG